MRSVGPSTFTECSRICPFGEGQSVNKQILPVHLLCRSGGSALSTGRSDDEDDSVHSVVTLAAVSVPVSREQITVLEKCNFRLWLLVSKMQTDLFHSTVLQVF